MRRVFVYIRGGGEGSGLWGDTPLSSLLPSRYNLDVNVRLSLIVWLNSCSNL